MFNRKNSLVPTMLILGGLLGASATQADETFVIFANVDMYADSKRLRKELEG